MLHNISFMLVFITASNLVNNLYKGQGDEQYNRRTRVSLYRKTIARA